MLEEYSYVDAVASVLYSKKSCPQRWIIMTCTALVLMALKAIRNFKEDKGVSLKHMPILELEEKYWI